MAISINTNIPSMQAQISLERAQNGLDTAMQRLSTGYRINSAADDAAGMQISNRMSSQINGLSVAVRNANDGISIAQTAEGAMTETASLLQRMRDLAVQSASDSNSSDDRIALNGELKQLGAELNRIAESTTFAGQKLLDGSFVDKNIQVGAYANEIITVNVNSVSGKDIGIMKGATLTFPGMALPGTTAIAAQSLTIGVNGNESNISIEAGDSAQSIASKVTSAVSSMSGKAKTSALVILSAGDSSTWDTSDTISLTVNNTTKTSPKTAATIAEAAEKLAEELASLANLEATVDKTTATSPKIKLVDSSGKNITLSASSTEGGSGSNSLTFTAEARPLDYAGDATEEAKSITSEKMTVVGDIKWVGSDNNATYTMKSDGSLVPTLATATKEAQSGSMPVDSIDITTYAGAQQAIKILDHAIADVDSNRGTLGAIQNRFQHTIYNLQNVRENMMGSRSRIKDTDYASEMSKLTRDQVLKQASMSGLNRANTMQQEVLALLQ
ncbi:flagellin N-terminal helical domain-containing protein [Endozoicomonas acroporae]|uniref:flagellin N-terminal helical domain-containing protein n=1 Tax=Endozoicomonas acroporae TaxID=1701104 RepID=UPI000C78AB4E|nr:flagellin [Endozoicomonas acroporae]